MMHIELYIILYKIIIINTLFCENAKWRCMFSDPGVFEGILFNHMGWWFDIAGKPLSYIRGLYLRLKDEVFVGSRPYQTDNFEAMLKQEFGEDTVMTDFKKPRLNKN